MFAALRSLYLDQIFCAPDPKNQPLCQRSPGSPTVLVGNFEIFDPIIKVCGLLLMQSATKLQNRQPGSSSRACPQSTPSTAAALIAVRVPCREVDQDLSRRRTAPSWVLNGAVCHGYGRRRRGSVGSGRGRLGCCGGLDHGLQQLPDGLLPSLDHLAVGTEGWLSKLRRSSAPASTGLVPPRP